MADNQRILLGSTAEVECKLGPTPFIINSITLKIGDKTVGVSNTPTAVKGSAAPGGLNIKQKYNFKLYLFYMGSTLNKNIISKIH